MKRFLIEKFYSYLKYKNFPFMLYSLRKAGITNIKPIHFKNWHAGFAYFTGKFKGKKVFIKFDVFFNILKNEIIAFDILKKDISDYLININYFWYDKKGSFIVYDFFEGIHLSSEFIIANPNILKNISNILDTFKKYEIIHRDIKLDNFMILNNKIKVIDFSFAISKKYNNLFSELNITNTIHCETLRALNENLKPSKYHWDDFYSITKILEGILISYKLEEEQKYILENFKKNFQKNIGKLSYKIQCKV